MVTTTGGTILSDARRLLEARREFRQLADRGGASDAAMNEAQDRADAAETAMIGALCPEWIDANGDDFIEEPQARVFDQDGIRVVIIADDDLPGVVRAYVTQTESRGNPTA